MGIENRQVPISKKGELCPKNGPSQRLQILNALMTKVVTGKDGLPIRTPILDKTNLNMIRQSLVDHPDTIQMGAYTDYLGLGDETVAEIREKQLKQIPQARLPYIKKLEKVIETTPTVPDDLSLRNINPFTPFENNPPILFGMGGGSQRLCQGLPFDVLKMVLTAEKIRRELDAGPINILCANDITHTNIGKDPSFSIKSIDRVMAAERDLLQLAVQQMGLGDHFNIFLSTDLERIIGADGKNAYDEMVEHAKKVPFIHDQHYAMEIAEMYSLINQKLGGIKLGWFMNNPNPVEPKYIMDEQPFDARYALYLASQGLTNTVSIPYVHAGFKLLPDKNGFAQKAAPYIDYDPPNRVLLSPFENPTEKLEKASRHGGGTNLKQVQNHFAATIDLFESLILGERIPVHLKGTSQVYGEKIQFILDFIFNGNRYEAEKIFKDTFPNSINN